jgi:hypothetical protein
MEDSDAVVCFGKPHRRESPRYNHNFYIVTAQIRTMLPRCLLTPNFMTAVGHKLWCQRLRRHSGARNATAVGTMQRLKACRNCDYAVTFSFGQ